MQDNKSLQFPHYGQEAFLQQFFTRLQDLSGIYCVLHSHDTLPHYVENDLDIAVNNVDLHEVETLLWNVAEEINWEIVQRLWYDIPICMFYVLRSKSGPPCSIKIDILLDEYGIGRYGFSSSLLTDDRLHTGIFYHSNPSIEFCYKLTKRIRKGKFKSEDKEILNTLFRNGSQSRIREVMNIQYGTWGTNIIIGEFSKANGFTGTLPYFKVLAILQLIRCRYSAPTLIVRRLIWLFSRIYYRISQPAGIVLQVPDISMEELALLHTYLDEQLGSAFRKVEVSRRPGILRRFIALSRSTLLICSINSAANMRIQQTLFKEKKYDTKEIWRNSRYDMLNQLKTISTDAILLTLRNRARHRICKNSNN